MIGAIVGSLAISGTAFGAVKAYEKYIKVRFANIKLIVDGKTIQTKAEPFIYNGNVYAPVATVANGMEIGQRWNNSVPSVEFTRKPVGDTIQGRDARYRELDADTSQKNTDYVALFGDQYLVVDEWYVDPDYLAPTQRFSGLMDGFNGEFVTQQNLLFAKGDFPNINNGWFAIHTVTDKGNHYITTYRLENEKRTQIDMKKLDIMEGMSVNVADGFINQSKGGKVIKVNLLTFNNGKIQIGQDLQPKE
ncbi:stalk domain-containing protein [Aneurinibacillus tyrosinisolvens]|uniref:stalk domain-containing protein n=1 Tax=Aneurinibacillus tyrosinisolvens TaxID=1443435 RepID=UPI00063EE4EA|nr:stalk domain-containing protein [Aneurinibacillus tyrosinisolvens]